MRKIIKEEKSNMITDAVGKTLRPMIRMLVKIGFGFRDFSSLTRNLYLKESANVLKDEDKDVTASSLSIISGIHRKETSDFLQYGDNNKKLKGRNQGISAGAVLIAEWISNPIYQDSDYKPRTLSYIKGKDHNKSFTELAETITSDLRAKPILEELLRLELVTYEGNHVSLEEAAFLPQKDLEEKLNFFSRNISEHITAASENVQNEAPPFFERSTFQEGLSNEDLETIDEAVRLKGMEVLKEIYKLASRLAQKNTDINSEKAKGRFTFGMYLNIADKEPDDQ